MKWTLDVVRYKNNTTFLGNNPDEKRGKEQGLSLWRWHWNCLVVIVIIAVVSVVTIVIPILLFLSYFPFLSLDWNWKTGNVLNSLQVPTTIYLQEREYCNLKVKVTWATRWLLSFSILQSTVYILQPTLYIHCWLLTTHYSVHEYTLYE